MNLAQEFKVLYPNCQFRVVGDHHEAVHEDCFYLNGHSPKPALKQGEFLEIRNQHGGRDTVSVSNLASCHKLASWHNQR